MHCHCTDDVACLLTCQVIACPSLVATLAKGTPASHVKKGEGLGRHCSPGIMRMVMTTWVVTIWMMWHMPGHGHPLSLFIHLVMWHCHTVVIVGVHSGCWGGRAMVAGSDRHR